MMHINTYSVEFSLENSGYLVNVVLKNLYCWKPKVKLNLTSLRDELDTNIEIFEK